MDTFNNVANSASRAIFGTGNQQSGTEPVSGETGNTASGEPYDRGNVNADTTNSSYNGNTGNDSYGGDNKYAAGGDSSYGGNNATDSTLGSSNNYSGGAGSYDNNTSRNTDSSYDNTTTGNTGSSDYTSGGTSSYDNNNNARATDSSFGNDNNNNTTSSDNNFGSNDYSSGTDLPGNTSSTGPIRPEHDQDKTGVTSAHQPASGFADDRPTNSNDTSGPGPTPSVGADPTSGASFGQKEQHGADRPLDEPTGEGADAVRDSKRDAEGVQGDNNDYSSGDRSTNTLGGAGGAGGNNPSSNINNEDEDGPQSKSTGTGTGEQWVKTTGVQADGGNFDASQPGAGREADRLLEEKGIHHVVPGKNNSVDQAGDNVDDDGTGKPSLKDKIKAKLHKN